MIAAALPVLTQVIWSGLLILGLQFLFIALRLREDRTFLLLGCSLLLLVLMVGADIWILMPAIQARAGEPRVLEAWNCAFQILACGYVFSALWFTHSLTGRPSMAVVKPCGAALAAAAAGFAFDALSPRRLLLGLEDWEWRTTAVYDWVFAPLLIGVFAYVVAITFLGFRRAPPPGRRTLGYLCAAYVLLFVSGILDFVALWTGVFLSDSYVIFGALGMGVIGTFIFADRLLGCYAGQRRSLLEIAGILGTLEAERPLSEIGLSAARLSADIRDQVSSLKRDSALLKSGPGYGSRQEFLRIDNARRKLERYTAAILDYSTSSMLGPRVECDLAALVRACIRKGFSGVEGRIRISAFPADAAAVTVWADPAKLEKAFAELLKNALEADSASIEVRLRVTEGDSGAALAVEIEDRGEGCPAGGVDAIARPFFTTRKTRGACGLGASAADATLKAHGGSLRFRPAPGGVGLVAEARLPLTRARR